MVGTDQSSLGHFLLLCFHLSKGAADPRVKISLAQGLALSRSSSVFIQPCSQSGEKGGPLVQD